MDQYNRWQKMITLLNQHPIAPQSTQPMRPGRDGTNCGARNIAEGPCTTPAGIASRRSSIVAVEMQTNDLMLISWSDSTRCRYIDQRWIRARSRRSGYCALSGRAIRPGDAIYKPQCRGMQHPANSTEMVLASELQRAVAGEDMR